jgi:hypothetical protein
MYPPPDPAPEAYYQGIAERRGYRQVATGKQDKQSKAIFRSVVEHVRQVVCDPATCPFASGDLPNLPDGWAQRVKGKASIVQGRPMCKPHVALAFELDLPGVGSVGADSKFTSTSWRTARTLYASLARIATRTGGWLAGVPLNLVLAEEMGETPEGTMLIPFVYLETRWPSAALEAYTAQKAAELSGHQEQLKRLAAASVAVLEAEATPDAEAAHNLEFSPDTADLPLPAAEEVAEGEFTPAEKGPEDDGEVQWGFRQDEEPAEEPADEPLPGEADLRRRCKDLAASLGLSDAEQAQDLADCDSPDDYFSLLDSYTARMQARAQQKPKAKRGSHQRLDLGVGDSGK